MKLPDYNKLINPTGKKAEPSTLILCLDKSGSMSGKPFDALKLGALDVAKRVMEDSIFENFLTYVYDDKVHKVNFTDYETYEK